MLEAVGHCEVYAPAYCVFKALRVERRKWIGVSDNLWLVQEHLLLEPSHTTRILEDDTNLKPGPAVVDVLEAILHLEANFQGCRLNYLCIRKVAAPQFIGHFSCDRLLGAINRTTVEAWSNGLD